ncbi:furin-like protease [Acrasis kona]|uniref:Furin-like protease n=1 Tax=Acrasis kona TaxID=1008807 RepID=A0AAW2Z2D6_9EUKA
MKLLLSVVILAILMFASGNDEVKRAFSSAFKEIAEENERNYVINARSLDRNGGYTDNFILKLEKPDIEKANSIAEDYGFIVKRSVPGSDNVYILREKSTTKRDVRSIQSIKQIQGVVNFDQEKKLSYTKR